MYVKGNAPGLTEVIAGASLHVYPMMASPPGGAEGIKVLAVATPSAI